MSHSTPALKNQFDPAALRKLTEPPVRVPLPAHVGAALALTQRETLRENIAAGLASWNTDITQVDHINIAWPRKHPRTEHRNKADSDAQVLKSILHRLYPTLSFNLAAGIYETVHLDRSSATSRLGTIMDHQRHEIDTTLQEDPMPFFAKEGADGEYFILTDWTIDVGTTMADLASYITHNGGRVLAVVSGAEKTLRPDIDDDAIARRIALLGAEAGLHYNPVQWTALLNTVLAGHGRSLAAMTQGEIDYIFDGGLRRRPEVFPALLKELGWNEKRCRTYMDAFMDAGPHP